MEHHWVAPDSVQNNVNNYQLSTSRYWSFNGFLPSGFRSSFKLNYDGTPANGFLDLDLFSNFRDTLILVYRKSPKFDWVEYPHYTKTRLAHNRGYVTVDSLLLGEYTFALKKFGTTTSINKLNNVEEFKIYPNPTDGFVWVENLSKSEYLNFEVYDLKGKLIYNAPIKSKTKIETSTWVSGTYFISISDNEKVIHTDKLLVK